MSTYNKQVGGSHYKDMAIQPADFINKNNLQFAEGNAIKYICRHQAKGKLQDIEKAIQAFDQFIDPAKSGEQMIENFFEAHREIRLWKIRLSDRGVDYMIDNKDKMIEVLENVEVTITKKLRDEIA